MKMKIVSAGPLTTIQDKGRQGYMRYGITTSGVMDDKAYAYGNYLVGNSETEACLEMTFKGVVMEFEGQGEIAIVGADMTPLLNGIPVSNNTKIAVKTKDILELGFAKTGLRGYLFCKGGIEVPLVYGSRSTNLKCGFGGFHGRKLQNGDILESGKFPMDTGLSKTEPIQLEGSIISENRSFSYRIPEENDLVIRVILGPQEDYFTEQGVRTFLSSEYKITPESDRMGIRLSGNVLEAVKGMDIISDAIPLGSIQVSADGQPIILLADRQTTGGYAKIATVISDDIWKLAQSRPGMSLHFKMVTLRQAQKIMKKQLRFAG